VIEYQLIL